MEINPVLPIDRKKIPFCVEGYLEFSSYDKIDIYFKIWLSFCFMIIWCCSKNEVLFFQNMFIRFSFWAGPGHARKLSTNLYDIYRCWVYSEWTPDDGQRNCLKHVVSCQNKAVELVHLVGFIIKEICYDVQSHKRKIKETYFQNIVCIGLSYKC